MHLHTCGIREGIVRATATTITFVQHELLLITLTMHGIFYWTRTGIDAYFGRIRSTFFFSYHFSQMAAMDSLNRTSNVHSRRPTVTTKTKNSSGTTGT